MDMLNELNSLVEEYNVKNYALENKTSNITKKIKDWCIKEDARINTECDKLYDFVAKNHKLIFSCKGGSKRGYSCMNENENGIVFEIPELKIYYVGDYNECLKVERIDLGSSSNERCYLPKLHKYRYEDFGYRFSEYDIDSCDVIYWTDYKKMLEYKNNRLIGVTKEIKNLLQKIIEKKNEIIEDTIQVTKDIESKTMNEIEIRFKIRV